MVTVTPNINQFNKLLTTTQTNYNYIWVNETKGKKTTQKERAEMYNKKCLYDGKLSFWPCDPRKEF